MSVTALNRQIGHGCSSSAGWSTGYPLPARCGESSCVMVVLGRRSGCEPFHDNHARAGRRSLSGIWRWIATGGERRTAYGSQRGSEPLAADGPIYPQSGRVGLRAVGPRHVLADTTDHAIPWSRLRDEAPSPGKWGGTEARLYRIGSRDSPLLFTRLVVFCYTNPPVFCSAGNPRALIALLTSPCSLGCRDYSASPLVNIALTTAYIMSRC